MRSVFIIELPGVLTYLERRAVVIYCDIRVPEIDVEVLRTEVSVQSATDERPCSEIDSSASRTS